MKKKTIKNKKKQNFFSISELIIIKKNKILSNNGGWWVELRCHVCEGVACERVCLEDNVRRGGKVRDL